MSVRNKCATMALLMATLGLSNFCTAAYADLSRKDELHRTLLIIYERQHKNADTKSEYLEVLRATPNDGIMHHNFAKFLDRTGDLAGAGMQYKDAARLDPSEEHCGDLGNWYMRNKNYQEALPWLKKAGPKYSSQASLDQQYLNQLREIDNYNRQQQQRANR